MTLTAYTCEADLGQLGPDDDVVEAAEVVPVATEEESGQREVSGTLVYFHADCWHDAMPNFTFRRRGRLRELLPTVFGDA
jgi:hypothetical protein